MDSPVGNIRLPLALFLLELPDQEWFLVRDGEYSGLIVAHL